MADSPSIDRIKLTDPSIFTPVYGDAIHYLGVVCDSEGTGDCFLQKRFWDGFAGFSNFRLPTFYQLLAAQVNDGDPGSLSLDDLKDVKKEIDRSESSRRKTELAFMGEHGEPMAVIELSSEKSEKNEALATGSYRLVRLADGAYWVGSEKGGDIRFTPVDQALGKKMEEVVALERLEFLSANFNGSSAMKNTANGPAGGEIVLSFGDVDYSLANRNAQIAYSPQSEEAKVWLKQPANGCVVVTVLNGAILEGVLPKDWDLVMRFYKKLGGGRVYMFQLNGLPGLTFKQLSSGEVASTVHSGKPVVAVTPYFWAHAVLITEKDEVTGNFRAADPVSGMMIPLRDSEGRIDFIQYYQVEITDKEAFLASLSLPEPKKYEEQTMQERIMDAVKQTLQ